AGPAAEPPEETLPRIQAPEGPAAADGLVVATPDVVGLSARQALAVFARLRSSGRAAAGRRRAPPYPVRDAHGTPIGPSGGRRAPREKRSGGREGAL